MGAWGLEWAVWPSPMPRRFRRLFAALWGQDRGTCLAAWGTAVNPISNPENTHPATLTLTSARTASAAPDDSPANPRMQGPSAPPAAATHVATAEVALHRNSSIYSRSSRSSEEQQQYVGCPAAACSSMYNSGKRYRHNERGSSKAPKTKP